jgi:hypothetical protein
MRRRELVMLGVTAVAWPPIARAQNVPRRIGCLVTGSPESYELRVISSPLWVEATSGSLYRV